jgi:hypothetical protein
VRKTVFVTGSSGILGSKAVEHFGSQDLAIVDKNRKVDHTCYIFDLGKFKPHYPNWGITNSLDDILRESIAAGTSRGAASATSK